MFFLMKTWKVSLKVWFYPAFAADGRGIIYTTPKVSLTVTRVRCVLGIKNDGNIDGMIKTQQKKQRISIESHVAFWPINTAYANVRTTKKK